MGKGGGFEEGGSNWMPCDANLCWIRKKKLRCLAGPICSHVHQTGEGKNVQKVPEE